MIVQVRGNVKFPITLDPTVWIFDDRKILLEDFLKKGVNAAEDEALNDDQDLQQKTKPPVNRSLTKYEREKVLENSYIMPIKEFLYNSEPEENVVSAILHTDHSDVEISFSELEDSALLFAYNGKPLTDGPVHVYVHNKSNPIKGVHTITLK